MDFEGSCDPAILEATTAAVKDAFNIGYVMDGDVDPAITKN
jgi:hypothetical protein